MKTLILNAETWQNADDVYDSFFRAVGAPDWHGRNFNALSDSIATGSVNKIEIPYLILVKNSANAGSDARRMLEDFKKLIEELAAGGCEVAIQIEE